MRTDAAGQSALLMVDVAEVLAARGIPYAVILRKSPHPNGLRGGS